MSDEEIAHQHNKYRGVDRPQMPETVQPDPEGTARDQWHLLRSKVEQRADRRDEESEIRAQFEARYGKRPEIDRDNAR